MTNPQLLTRIPQVRSIEDGRQSAAAGAIQRGTQRCLHALGFTSLAEMTLTNGRRADIVALSQKGEIWIVEVKSSVNDFRTDNKWPEYEPFTDRLLFAVAPDFPIDILPVSTGILLADAYGGEIVRPAPLLELAAARRKAMTLRIARVAANRLQFLADPDFIPERIE
jgi:hypothetical protein